LKKSGRSIKKNNGGWKEMEEIVIQINDIRKKYRKNTALNGITVNIHENRMIGLVGANGSGKTTLMKICAGLEEKSSGSVLVYGADVSKDIHTCEEVIYSMHDLPVGKQYKIVEILKFYDISYPHFDIKFCKKMLELFGISLKKTCRTLSQGQKSLVHFSCALATRCKVTLLDEPFIGVDIEKRKMVYEILLRDFMEHPRTIILSGHNLSEIEGILSEMLLIHEGKMIFYQDMDSVREMLFRADGREEEIQEFTEGKETVCVRTKEIGSYAILKGSVTSMAAQEAKACGLKVSTVSPEDVSVYLTTSEEGKELERLWEN